MHDTHRDVEGAVLADLANRLPAAIALIDAEDRVAYANDAFASLVGDIEKDAALLWAKLFVSIARDEHGAPELLDRGTTFRVPLPVGG